MQRLLLLILMLVVLVVTSGCMASSAGVAPSTTPIAGRDYTIIGETSGSGIAVNLLGVAMTAGNPTRRAREASLEKLGADGLVNTTVDTKIYNLLLVMVQRTQVSGQAIKFVN